MSDENTSRKPDAPPQRERWSSRTAFYFAAIGAAVGFGNVWRFPSLVYQYGGGAFFVPYLLALVFVGLPILVLEISLGQYYETGDVDVFGGINKRLRGVGLCSIACGYIGVTYYSMLLSWVAHAFFDSFGSENFWGNEVTGSEAAKYFEDHIIGMGTLRDDLRPTRIVWKNVGYSLFTWAVVYLCIAFGIRVTGRITYFTMGLPTILLFVMLGRSVSLEGSQEGIRQYLSSNWSVLVNQPEVWTKAVSQIFYSLGKSFQGVKNMPLRRQWQQRRQDQWERLRRGGRCRPPQLKKIQRTRTRQRPRQRLQHPTSPAQGKELLPFLNFRPWTQDGNVQIAFRNGREPRHWHGKLSNYVKYKMTK